MLPGLQRFKIPAGQKTRLMFRPWIKRQPPAGGPKPTSVTLTQPVALSSTMETLNLKIDIPDLKDYRCLECFSNISEMDHFKYVLFSSFIAQIIRYLCLFSLFFSCLTTQQIHQATSNIMLLIPLARTHEDHNKNILLWASVTLITRRAAI